MSKFRRRGRWRHFTENEGGAEVRSELVLEGVEIGMVVFACLAGGYLDDDAWNVAAMVAVGASLSETGPSDCKGKTHWRIRRPT
jgi:hypothetical protein